MSQGAARSFTEADPLRLFRPVLVFPHDRVGHARVAIFQVLHQLVEKFERPLSDQLGFDAAGSGAAQGGEEGGGGEVECLQHIVDSCFLRFLSGGIGYDEAGQLTEKVRRKPYCVILFDEIEKAHPDVLNILLQILDDGHITDAQGRNVNFENTVIVMTSNAGSDARTSAGSVGFGRTADQQGRERAMKALESFLRPEFINRVDEVVCFNKLTEENFRAIAGIMLGELRDSLDARGLTFDWDGSLVDYLVKKSYSVQYGARNLRRTIQKDLEDPIAEKLIDAYQNPLHALHAKADGEHVTLESE